MKYLSYDNTFDICYKVEEKLLILLNYENPNEIFYGETPISNFTPRFMIAQVDRVCELVRDNIKKT